MFEQYFQSWCSVSISGTHEVGTVGSLRKVKDAVMDYTDHTLIVGVSGECFFYANH